VITAIVDNTWAVALIQAAVAVVAVMGVLLIARRYGVSLLGEASWSMLRGFVQVVIVGSVLAVLLQGPWWTAILVLLGMFAAAASIARKRAKAIPGAYRLILTSLLIGAGSVIVVMALLGVLDASVSNLVPVGSMLLSNAMTACTLMLERLRSDVVAHRADIEAKLSLGGSPDDCVAPYVETAVRAAMIPQVNTMTALGIVFIPGLMSGMVLAGADPVQAAIYQFVVIALILAAGGLTAMVAAVLVRSRFFTPAQQLVVREA
jgi:putative ABC transport system permease protein